MGAWESDILRHLSETVVERCLAQGLSALKALLSMPA